jgi:hemolysin activation/secretion protein
MPINQLDKISAPFLGLELNRAQLDDLVNRVTAAYQDKGWILTRAYLPPQNASDGRLTIAVLVGRYGEISVQNDSLIRDSVTRDYFKSFKKEAPARRKDIERAVLLLSELAGTQRPNVTLSAGKEPGLANFHAEVGRENRISGYGLIDNQGSKYTGRFRFGLGLNLNSPLGLGDRFSFNGMVSEKGKGLLNGRLSYALPLGSSGLIFDVGASRTTYELGREYADLEAVGRSDSLDFTLSYPIVKGRASTLTASAASSLRKIRDEVMANDYRQDKKASAGTVGLKYDLWQEVFNGRNLFLTIDGSVSFGNIRIKDASPDDPVDGGFSRANLYLSADLGLTQNFMASLRFRAQKTLRGERLDGSEQIIVSGPGGVRAYRETVSGDNGWTAELELRRNLPSAWRWQHSLGVFVATGRVWNEREDPLNPSVRLTDVGLGYRASLEPFFLTLQLSRAVGRWPESVEKERRTQIVGQMGVLF